MKRRTILIASVLFFGVVMLFSISYSVSGKEAYNHTKYSVKWDGVERTFYAFNEQAFKNAKAAPIVFVLHGGGGTADKLGRVMNFTFEKLAKKNGFVVIYPQGIKKYWNDGRIIREGDFSDADDVGFLNSLIDYSIKNFNGDPKRIYFTGLSNGGFMSTRMALEKSERIAAIAPVISSLSIEQMEAAKPSAPISVMIINGTADPLLPYNGGDIKVLGKNRSKCLSTDQTIEYWVKHNHCSTDCAKSTLADTNKSDGMTVSVFKWKNPKDNTEVILYKVNGGGHTWPGGRQFLPAKLVGRVCKDFNAADVIWDFFRTKTK